MVYKKKEQTKGFSPNKVRRFVKKRQSGNLSKPSAGGSGVSSLAQNKNNKCETNIKVIVRVRPPNDNELQLNSKIVIKVLNDKVLIFDPKEKENPFYYQGVVQKGRDLLKKRNKELQFIFDKIFDDTSTNTDLFEGSTKDLITSLLNGYNCSVFAYGATGAGKTHTMLGSSDDPGLTYHTVAELFSQMEKQSRNYEFNLGVSYLEIYNENVQDLLHKSEQLHLREDSRCEVIVAGLKIIPIKDADELLSLLAKGNKNRTQHPTDVNQESSRSHAVFQVYIEITNKSDRQVKYVKLSMIDLAGSERAAATGCKGARFKEGANINKSLLALGNCINNLADGIRHVPYRDSKLTRLLKDSLGGNCQTIMIANISPSSINYEDTYNTLRYANRAKKIKTCVKKNIMSCEMNIAGYIKMVEEQKKEINFLKQKLIAFESGLVQIPIDAKETEVTGKTDNTLKKTDSQPEKIAPLPKEIDNLVEIKNKLLELFDKKRLLNQKMLSLESADKILCYRMHYKKAADQRLHNLTAAVDILLSEEQNRSGKMRVNRSLDYFKRQRDSLKIRMKETWKELCATELEMQEINSEILSKNLSEKLADVSSIQIQEIDKCIVQQQLEHVKKITALQQCELNSMCNINKSISSTLQSYYNMMRGYGVLTPNMKEDFKQLIKSLEGIKNIKWSDDEMIEEEKDFYNLSCLSVAQLKDPINNQIPVFTESFICDKEHQSETTQSALSTTFDLTTCENINITEALNTTVTLDEKPETISSTSSKQNLIKSVNKNTLSNSLSLQNKAKKHILSDMNNTNNKTPIKQFKKFPHKQKNFNRTVGSLDKENKNTQKDSVMSAKSIAILNNLKVDKIKASPSILKDRSKVITEDMSFKAIRIKERRGLGSVHPYQKPKQK